jgi:hypothetical protein
MDSNLLRDAIRAALLQRAGVQLDSRAMAEATSAIYRVLAAQLSPVIGASGLEALFTRVLHGAINDRPLAGPVKRDGKLAALPQFAVYLSGQPVAAATEASTEMLAGFCELLATFIGSPLSERLLAPVWGLPPAVSDCKNSS